jgi:hypothetical protein
MSTLTLDGLSEGFIEAVTNESIFTIWQLDCEVTDEGNPDSGAEKDCDAGRRPKTGAG